VTYSLPNVNYNLGRPVKAGDYSTTTNNAHVRLSDYKYYFSVCKMTFSGNVQIGGALLPDVGSSYYDFYSVYCSDITSDLYLGIHQDTNAKQVDGYSLVISNEINPTPTIIPVLAQKIWHLTNP